jgi:hypothetical protein
MPVDEQLPTYGQFYDHAAILGDNDPTAKPKWADYVMCEITIKGDKNTSNSKRVFEDDGVTPIDHPTIGDLTIAYPRAWAAFQNNSPEYIDGTQLEVLPGIGKSAARNLQNDGIMTVEELAGLPDSVVINKSGMLELRNKAQAYMNVIEPEKAQAEKQAMVDTIAQLQAQMAELQKPKRGRPAKVELPA